MRDPLRGFIIFQILCLGQDLIFRGISHDMISYFGFNFNRKSTINFTNGEMTGKVHFFTSVMKKVNHAFLKTEVILSICYKPLIPSLYLMDGLLKPGPVCTTIDRRRTSIR